MSLHDIKYEFRLRYKGCTKKTGQQDWRARHLKINCSVSAYEAELTKDKARLSAGKPSKIIVLSIIHHNISIKKNDWSLAYL